MSTGGAWNRAGRRSGGARRFIIRSGVGADRPALSIQCFERRHADCRGNCKPFGPESCECPCHIRAAVRESEEPTK